MDNHHQDKVCVWLGDLGRDLPYLEQLHWKTYNIPPQGCVSETYFKRQILVQFTNSDRPEHAFANLYRYLHEECERSLGWQLLLPLSPGDEHSLKCMRIPATDEQRDFDELVLGLTKLLIDSLNEKELNRLISKDNFPKVNGSISRLETALAGKGVADAGTHIAFLRKLQELRSSSSAHRKGSNYDKIANAFGVGSQNLRSVFAGIVNQALAFLGFLVAVVQDGKLKKC